MNRINSIVAFFAIAYAISWSLWMPLWLPWFGVNELPALPIQHSLGAFGPMVAAYIVSALESGVAGPFDLLRRMFLWRGRVVWVAVALFVPIALLGTALASAAILSGEKMVLVGSRSSTEFTLLSALVFFVYNFVTFGFGEEVGWRGFALPRLQGGCSAFTASILLTLGWAIWHIPLFFYRIGYMDMGVRGISGWLFSLLIGSVLLTWLFNESEGSILVVALFHAGIDFVFTSSISTPLVTNIAGALIAIWAILVLASVGPRFLSGRGKMITQYGDCIKSSFMNFD